MRIITTYMRRINMRLVLGWLRQIGLFLLATLEMTIKIFYGLFYNGHKSTFGEAQFMGSLEKMLTFLPNNTGIILGTFKRLSLKRSFQGNVLVAPVGMGKTTGIIVPNILEAEGSVIVTDPSGEIHKLTAGHLASRGYEIQVLSTSDITHSFSYNPLAKVSNAKQAKHIADTLISSASPHSNGKDDFWNAGASVAIYLLIRVLLEEDPKYRNLHNIKFLLDSFGGNGELLDPMFLKHSDPILFSEYKGFISQTDKIKQSFISTAKTALEKFSDPDLCKLCSGQKAALDLKSFRKKPHALYIVSREDKISYYSFIYRLLYAEIFENLMEVPDKTDLPVFLFLDEFANIGKLESFESIATTIRKRRCSLTIVLQELKQLEKVYGKAEADTILFGGMASKIFYPGLGHETTKRISEMLGKKAVHYYEGGKSHVRERSLMTPDEVRMMKDNQALYIYANKPPLRFNITPFYKSRYLKPLTQIPPPRITNDLSSIELEYLKLETPSREEPELPMPDIEIWT